MGQVRGEVGMGQWGEWVCWGLSRGQLWLKGGTGALGRRSTEGTLVSHSVKESFPCVLLSGEVWEKCSGPRRMAKTDLSCSDSPSQIGLQEHFSSLSIECRAPLKSSVRADHDWEELGGLVREGKPEAWLTEQLPHPPPPIG